MCLGLIAKSIKNTGLAAFAATGAVIAARYVKDNIATGLISANPALLAIPAILTFSSIWNTNSKLKYLTIPLSIATQDALSKKLHYRGDVNPLTLKITALTSFCLGAYNSWRDPANKRESLAKRVFSSAVSGAQDAIGQAAIAAVAIGASTLCNRFTGHLPENF